MYANVQTISVNLCKLMVIFEPSTPCHRSFFSIGINVLTIAPTLTITPAKIHTIGPMDDDFAQSTLHLDLARFNVARTTPDKPPKDPGAWENALHAELAIRLSEGHWLEGLRAQAAAALPAGNLNPDAFVAWFASLVHKGPGQQHRLFDWLATHADLSEMRWFLTQEAAGEAGFDDLLAYTQVKLPLPAKLELARNYWDEMGHGKRQGMHGDMLNRMVVELALTPTLETTVWQSLALSNAMLGMAMTRRYAYQSIGALGVVELTAPSRVVHVSAGMRRLGMGTHLRAYFDLHAALDISHAKAWMTQVIAPLVEADPACAPLIAEGALIRLACGKRCFDRYSQEFGQAFQC